jgi:uncharacterized membrane protein
MRTLAGDSQGTSTFTPPPLVVGAPMSADRTARIASLDILRGAVMVLMAIDHVRVYSGLPAGGPTPGIFFTRWVTHFVAPIFIFLAGTGAYLHGRKLADRGKLSRFLLTRGAWLVLLELTVIRVAWTFNFDFAHYLLAGVIWVIGWSMIVMAALVWLPMAAIATFGVAVVVGHNLLQPVVGSLGENGPSGALSWLWQLLYLGGGFQLGANGPPLVILYVLFPWVGVMAAGYAFGQVMRMSPERRRVIALRLGLGAIAAFVVLRATNLYGDPRPWSGGGRLPAALSFLNTTKYPASLLFLLMTLGPAIALLPLLERARGRVARVLEVFGRVPFFYYLLHIPAIHVAAMLVSLVRSGSVNPWLFANHPMMNPPPPPGYMWGLPLLYLVTAIVVAALYVPCRRFAALKARSRSSWLSYL